jgi:hypothetical protein
MARSIKVGLPAAGNIDCTVYLGAHSDGAARKRNTKRALEN